MNLTVEQLRAIVPGLPLDRAQWVLVGLNAAMSEAQVNTRLRAAAFVAQWAHESAGFRYFSEIWGPTSAQQRYEGRRDLGNIYPGDGYRFRGRTPGQLTGRANYRICGHDLGLDLEGNPDLCLRQDVVWRVPAWYWKRHRLNALADVGDFVGITRAINGGYNGLADRQAYYARALRVISDGPPRVFFRDAGGANVVWDGKPTVYGGQQVTAAWVSQMQLAYPPGMKTRVGQLNLEVYPDGALQLSRAASVRPLALVGMESNMNIKPYWQSKTFWAVLLTALIGAYQILAPKYGLDSRWVEGAVFILGAFGLWGVRAATTSIGTPTNPIPSGPNNVVPIPALPAPAEPYPPLPTPDAAPAVMPMFSAPSTTAVPPEGLLKLLNQAFPAGIPALAVGDLLVALLPLGLDLADGDVHLNGENRLKVQEIIRDLQAKYGMGGL